ncbi:hypothetical protein [Streptomyces syringium]|uniref:hypothetical protein n=1 Tax=Streptomyces syringium TaxID=76729 RepID=UPI00340C701B
MLDASTWWERVNNQVLESALGLALLLVGLFKVLLPVLGVVGPLALATTTRTVGIDADMPLTDTTASGAVTLRGAGQAELVFHSPAFGDRLLLILPGLVGAVLLLVIFDVLIRLARTFHAGDFFVPRNARRLLVVSGLVFLIGTLPPCSGRSDHASPGRWHAGGAGRPHPLLPRHGGGVRGLADRSGGCSVPSRYASARRRRGLGLMPPEDPHEIRCHLDRLLADRSKTLTELADLRPAAIHVSRVHLGGEGLCRHSGLALRVQQGLSRSGAAE